MVYDTDKVKDLIPAYEVLFQDIKDNNLRILEVGVLNGGSLKWMLDYFPNANIVGVDKKLPDMEHKRLALVEANQNDTKKLREVAKLGFDIVIDDGCHFPKETENTFAVFFPGATHYIIEDWDAALNAPDIYKGMEDVVFNIVRRKHMLGISQLQVYSGRKSYAYFKK